MSEMTLVRGNKPQPTEKERIELLGLLYGFVDGVSERDKRAWRRLWNKIVKSTPGDVFTIWRHQRRSGPFHRRHMKMETEIFQAQEVINDFTQWRIWGKVGAGFVDWFPVGGQIVPIPKSISYADCDEDTMREFHLSWVAFLRTPQAAEFLWPHVSRKQALLTIETLLMEFGE